MDGVASTKGLVALVESTKPSFVPEFKPVLAAGGTGANGLGFGVEMPQW